MGNYWECNSAHSYAQKAQNNLLDGAKKYYFFDWKKDNRRTIRSLDKRNCNGFCASKRFFIRQNKSQVHGARPIYFDDQPGEYVYIDNSSIHTYASFNSCLHTFDCSYILSFCTYFYHHKKFIAYMYTYVTWSYETSLITHYTHEHQDMTDLIFRMLYSSSPIQKAVSTCIRLFYCVYTPFLLSIAFFVPILTLVQLYQVSFTVGEVDAVKTKLIGKV